MKDFELPSESLAQHIAIVGRTGSGKTYTAKGLVERLLDAQRRVCILDPTGAWYGLRSSHDGKSAGFPVAVFGGAHGDVPIAEKSGAALAAILAAKNLPAIVDLSEMLIGQRHRFVTDFCEALYRDNRAPLHLVIDEADEFCPQNPMPETKRMLHHVDRIVRRGRIRGFRVMLITQRPAVLHKNVLTQANTLIAMRLTAPQDRKAILAWVEGQADTAKAKEVLDSLARLKRGEGWVWAPEQDILRRVEFPRILTFDSSRAPDEGDVLVEPAKLADIDLGEIKAAFEEVEQEARTLEELKSENARLTRDLAAAQKRAGQAGVPEAEVQRRIREAVATQPGNISRNNSPDLRKALLKIGEVSAKALATWALEEGQNLTEPPQKSPTLNLPRKISVAPASGSKTGPQQRILDAIAWMESIGVDQPSQAAIAFLSGYSGPSNSAYKNPRAALKSAGLLQYLPDASLIALTDAGRAQANQPARTATRLELHDRILAKLGGPEQRILFPLLEEYPSAISNAQLAVTAGYSDESNSAYKNPRARLRSFGLVEYRDGGVRACDFLFPGPTK